MTSKQLQRLDRITRELTTLAHDPTTTYIEQGHLGVATLALDNIIRQATEATDD